MDIYRGNLALTVTDYTLRQLFEPYGVVDTAQVIIDRDTGRSKGFGFVAMTDSQAAQATIAGLHGQERACRGVTPGQSTFLAR